jgi:hypothetical protein
VGLDRLDAEEERVGDLGVGSPLGDESRDLLLARNCPTPADASPAIASRRCGAGCGLPLRWLVGTGRDVLALRPA